MTKSLLYGRFKVYLLDFNLQINEYLMPIEYTLRKFPEISSGKTSVTPSVHKMVTHTLKILQHLLHDF